MTTARLTLALGILHGIHYYLLINRDNDSPILCQHDLPVALQFKDDMIVSLFLVPVERLKPYTVG